MNELVNIWSIVFSVVNFAIVYFILEKTLFGTLAKTLHERQDRIEKSLENAEKVEELMQAIEEKRKQIIADANKEASEIIARYKREGEELTAEMKQKAAADIAKLEEEAKKKIQAERADMITALKTEAADLALLGAERIIEAKFDEKEDKILIQKYLEQIK